MLDANIQEQLKAYLERLEQPIQLITSLDESGNSEQMRELVNEIAALSDKVSVIKSNDSELVPSFRVAPLNNIEQRGVARFAGLPMGHEFTSLVLALLQMGGYPPKVDASVIEQIMIQPTSADQNTACTMPFGTEWAAFLVSSEVWADAS